jgi:hypothetical protein
LQAPAGAQIADRKWEYDLISTTQSQEPTLAGWTQTGIGWTQTGSGSVEYASFPSGFNAKDNIYSKYNQQPFTESANESNRRTVVNSTAGYIYWHWSRSSPTGTAWNRLIEDRWTSEFSKFMAFADSNSYSHTDRNGNTDSSVYYSDRGVGTVSWWWFRIDLKKSTYTDEAKCYNYEKVEHKESNTEVTQTDSIKNVQEWVRYYYN